MKRTRNFLYFVALLLCVLSMHAQPNQRLLEGKFPKKYLPLEVSFALRSPDSYGFTLGLENVLFEDTKEYYRNGIRFFEQKYIHSHLWLQGLHNPNTGQDASIWSIGVGGSYQRVYNSGWYVQPMLSVWYGHEFEQPFYQWEAHTLFLRTQCGFGYDFDRHGKQDIQVFLRPGFQFSLAHSANQNHGYGILEIGLKYKLLGLYTRYSNHTLFKKKYRKPHEEYEFMGARAGEESKKQKKIPRKYRRWKNKKKKFKVP